MRRHWPGLAIMLIGCGADIEEQTSPWTLDELEPDSTTTTPPTPEPSPGTPTSRRGLIVLAPPCSECRATPHFYPFPATSNGPGTTRRKPPGVELMMACDGSNSLLWEGEPWTISWDDSNQLVYDEHARETMFDGLAPTGVTLLAVDAYGVFDGDQFNVDTFDPMLCETLRHVGVCLIPRLGDLCILETSPNSYEGPITTVLAGPTAHRASHAEEADTVSRFEWSGSTTELDHVNELAVRMDIDWYGSTDPSGTPEDFVPSRRPEGEITNLRIGAWGPDSEIGLTLYPVDEDVSWVAVQTSYGLIDQTIVSYAVMTHDESLFWANYLIWGATESRSSER